MAAAQSRLKHLQATALGVGRSIMKFGALFSGLFAGIAAFGVGAIFRKLFEGADEAAAAAEQRERKLTAALMAQAGIRKQGREYAEAQTKEIYEHTLALSKQGVVSQGLLNNAAGNLAMARLGPKEIVKTLPLLADSLVAFKGINATQEDMNALSKAFGKAYLQGVGRPLSQFGIMLSKPEQKLLTQKAKVGDLAFTYKFLMDKVAQFSGESARALKTPEGRIHALDNAMAVMRVHIGKESLEARAKMADAWRGLLPEIEPFLIDVKKMTANAMASIADFIRTRGVPALKALSAWAKGPGAEAWTKIKNAWNDMAGKVGKALGDQFKSLAGSGKTWGDVAVSAMGKVAEFFSWVGNNAPAIIKTIEAITIALIALEAAAFVQGNITLLGIGAAIAGIAKVSSEYQKFKDLMAGELVSDPDHFTKHWYLMNQTWTETFAGLTGIVQAFKEGWDKSINELVAKWEWLKSSILGFKMPDWWNKFWERQTAEQKQSAAYTAAMAEQEAGRVAEAERLAAIQKTWRDNTVTAGDRSAAMAMAPPFLSAGTAGRGRGPILPALAQRAPVTTVPGVPQAAISGGYRGMPAMASVESSMAEILPFWQRTTTSMSDDWRTTMNDVITSAAQMPQSISPISDSIQSSVIQPIESARAAWVDLAALMATPISIPQAAVPAAAAAATAPAMAAGGIVTKPTLALMGEAGPEAVVPLRRGGGGLGGTNVTYAPNITIHGGASEQAQAAMETKLRDLAREFVADFKRAQSHERRLSYEGGYG